MTDDEKIYCATPTPGKKGVNIPKWKYVAVRTALLDIIDAAGLEGAPLKPLADQVKERLSLEDRATIGSVMWHLMAVKLDMEVKGEIARTKAKGGQRLVRA
jgi:hypothetical protein